MSEAIRHCFFTAEHRENRLPAQVKRNRHILGTRLEIPRSFPSKNCRSRVTIYSLTMSSFQSVGPDMPFALPFNP